MKINYNVEVETFSNGKPSYCIINGRCYVCDDSKPVHTNVINAITKYQKDLKANPLKDGLYNRAIYWPISLEIAPEEVMSKRYQIEATTHFYERCEQWGFPRGCYKALLYGEIIEAEVTDGQIVKIVTRLPNRKAEDEDICAAIALDYGKYFDVARVKTVWANMNYDNHVTIDKSKYIQEIT